MDTWFIILCGILGALGGIIGMKLFRKNKIKIEPKHENITKHKNKL